MRSKLSKAFYERLLKARKPQAPTPPSEGEDVAYSIGHPASEPTPDLGPNFPNNVSGDDDFDLEKAAKLAAEESDKFDDKWSMGE